MTPRPEIDALLRHVARHHDGRLARRLAVTAVVAGSSLVIVASLAWVLVGRTVPAAFSLSVAGLSLLAGLTWWWARRMEMDAAAQEADRFFKLKDGIASARHLASHAAEDPATALQWKWLEPRLAACDPATLATKFPKRPALLAVALAAAAIALALLPPSAAIREQEKIALETRQRITESKKELEQLIESLDKDIVAPEEKEGMKLDEFRQLVKEIDETGNRSEAARQFARIEQKIRDASRALDQQRDDETLKLAASELAKAEETEARKLGKKLDAKELREAAEMLEKLAAKKFDPKDLKKDAAAKKKALTEAKQDLAKMRAATKRLAAAGKQRQGARQAQGGRGQGAQGAGAGGGDGQAGEGAAGEGKSLEDMLAELDDAAALAEEDLEEMEFDPDAEPFDGEGDPMGRVNGPLGKLGKHLRGMHGKRMARSKLDMLRQALGQAQAFTQGQSQMLGMGQGGKQAGEGSSWSERKERDDSQKNGALAQLKGQQGSGPSLSAVEEAESGTGVSGRRGEARQRDFARQVESFVQRDDIPEALKLGVRNYFENLQSATKAE